VYALGPIAYECLSGQKPFVGEDPFAAALQRVHRTPPPLPADVPPRVAGVVSRALATDPGRRWPTAAEFALAAQRAVDGGPEVIAPHGPRLGSRRRWLRVVAAVAAAVVLLAAGAVTAWASRARGVPDGSGAHVTGTAAGTAAATGQHSGSARPASPPAGFVACGQALCPAAPMCWRGLIQQGDRPFPPSSEDCAAPHYWETFAVVYLPGDATTDRELSNLMRRTDIATICSAGAMAERSRQPAQTDGWRRDAWPIPVDGSTILVHCLAGSPEGETAGAVFRSS
jgi:serine/threonine-protein kinase